MFYLTCFNKMQQIVSVSKKAESHLTIHGQRVKKKEAEESLPGYDTVLIQEQYLHFRGACHLHLAVQKATPVQAWTGPEGSRRFRLQDLKTIDT
jgi:hypothetical protein